MTGTQTNLTGPDRRRHHFGRDVLAGTALGGLGWSALRRRRSHRRQDSEVHDDTGQPYSQAGSGSYVEKYSETNHDHTWRNRVLGGAAGIGGLAAMRSWMNRRRGREDESDISQYRPPLNGPPLGGHVTQSTAHVNIMEEGRPGYGAPQSQLGAATHSSYDSQVSEPHGRWGLGRLAAMGGLGEWYRRRRERREQTRVDDVRRHDYRDDGAYGRQEVQPLVGPGVPPERNDVLPGAYGPNYGNPPPMPGAVVGAPHPMPQNIPPPPRSNFGPPRAGPPLGPGATPPRGEYGVSTPPRGEYAAGTYGSPGQSHRAVSEHAGGARGDGLSPAVGGLARPPPVASPPRSAGSPGRHAASPPVSVKVRMHSDGRHVTLRRLNEEEAAVERENRRRAQGEPLGESMPSYPRPPGASPGSSAQQQISEFHLQGSEYGPQSAGQPAGSGIGSGPYDSTTGAPERDYASSRRRRRAERARADQRGTPTTGGRGVEFS